MSTAAPRLLDLPVKKPRDPLSRELAKNNRRQQLYLVTALRADQMAECEDICVSEDSWRVECGHHIPQ